MSLQQDPFLTQIAERIRYRAGASGAIKPPKSVYEWAMRYRMIDNRPFSLERFRPLQALYEDDHQRIVVMKPAQRGVSEWAVSLTCYALEYGAQNWVHDGSKAGLNVGIVFPAKADLNDFSKERLSDLKDESTHLSSMFGSDDFDALGFKKVGDSYLYLRGGYSKAGLRSFPADMIIFDEFDELNSSAVALGRRRLNASLVKREIDISTPSIPGRGISAAYLSSDQRVYQSKCGNCPEWNTYDFFRDVFVNDQPYDEWSKWSQPHVEASTVSLNCPRCSAPQSEKVRCAPGRWISLHPEITRTHGYHIPWWPFVFIDLAGLAFSAVSGEGAEVDEFYHSDLGLPHGAGEGGVTPEMIQQLSATLPDGLPKGPWRDTTMGVDVGSRLHYSISSVGPDGDIYLRAMDHVGTWTELDALMMRYQVRQAVVDGEPETHSTLDFLSRWPGRTMRSFYPTGVAALRGTLFHQKPNTQDLQINRSLAMDAVLSLISTAREHWPREFTSNPDIVAQMTSSSRVKITDEDTGQQHYEWMHVGPDHFWHAHLYNLVARRTLPKMSNQMPAVGGTRMIIGDPAVSPRTMRESGPNRFSVIR